LNPIAALRAPTIANTIQAICAKLMPPSAAAKAAPLKAKGNAKMLCENLIMRP
jgi:hypothetical protein